MESGLTCGSPVKWIPPNVAYAAAWALYFGALPSRRTLRLTR